jgi:branched-chain amino acid transport system permease protein
VKVQAFAISAALVSLAGGLYAAHVRYIDPSIASLDGSILMLSMVIAGGLGNIRGPIIGSAVLLLIPELLRFLALPEEVAANLRLLIYGGLLIAVVHFRPQGLGGVYRVE